ncbi:hypothetical protein [Staphylococcus argensis]|nr:hypothetical protein [Staphylococcus argensis]
MGEYRVVCPCPKLGQRMPDVLIQAILTTLGSCIVAFKHWLDKRNKKDDK